MLQIIKKINNHTIYCFVLEDTWQLYRISGIIVSGGWGGWMKFSTKTFFMPQDSLHFPLRLLNIPRGQLMWLRRI